MTPPTVRTHPFRLFLLVLAAAVPCLADSPATPSQTTKAAVKQPAGQKSVLVDAMEKELERSTTGFAKADPPPYYIGYRLTEQQRSEVQGSNGALLSSEETHTRWLQTSVRVGSYQLDNTRKVGGQDPGFQASFGASGPVDDDASLLRRVMWQETDRQYRGASEALLRIQTSKDVKVESLESAAPDFSEEKSHVYYGPHASFQVDRRPWEDKVR